MPLALDGRRKACLLARDLRALGTSAAEVAALPRFADLPTLETPAEALGCLYVLEGATLGGQVVARLVAGRFGFDRGSGCAFFASYGERVGSMWRELGAALVTFTDTTGDDEAVVRSACATFATFERWFAPLPGAARGAPWARYLACRKCSSDADHA